MKILFFPSIEQSLYGANRSGLDLILGLTKKGHDVRVICSYKGDFSRELETKKIHVYYQKYCSCAGSIYSFFLYIIILNGVFSSLTYKK